MKYTVKKQDTLLDFLIIHVSRKQAKLYLKYKQVYINGISNNQFDYLLNIGDSIEIRKETTIGLAIIYEDKDIVVIDKPAGLLSMAGGGEKEKTAYHLVGEYVKQKDRSARVFIVHRLDRDTSGVLLFAKNEKMKNALQENWNTIVTKRGYMAIVEGHLDKQQGTIKNYLNESKTQMVYIASNGGKLAITNYQVIQESKYYSLLEVFLETGRKNQIRVHMQSLGHSIIGDKKYGATANPIKRMGLHCHCFAFKHPVTKQSIEVKAAMPSVFTNLINSKV